MSEEEQGREPERSTRGWGRRGLGCLTIIVVLIFAYYGLYFILGGTQQESVQHIAHRGGPVYNPENTIAAFEHAIQAGSDWLEFDVQRTSDGVLVVIHDDTVDRTTNGTGFVGDLTLEEIQTLDAGNGEEVPTFERVIELAKENDIGILPEAKSPDLYPGIGKEMVTTIQKYDYTNQTIIQSFDPETLVEVREMDSSQAVCPLYGLWQFDLSGSDTLDADFVCPMAEMVLLYPWMIRQVHNDGKEAYVWFGIIESPLVMRIMMAMGADGLMVDDTISLMETMNP